MASLTQECDDLRPDAPGSADDDDLHGVPPCCRARYDPPLALIVGRTSMLSRAREPASVRRVMEIAEEVLTKYPQEGRDYIGACMLEGIPTGGEAVLWPLAGPVTRQFMQPFLE